MKLNIKSSIKLRNGVRMPILGLGTWQSKKKECENAVYVALKDGYRHIDTAQIYGNEREVGNAIRRAMRDFKIKRKELFVTTKVFNTFGSRPYNAFYESLEKLGIEYIDLYLIHWPAPMRLSAWKKMQQLLKDKKVRALGVSNFSIKQIDQIIEMGLPIPSVNQVEFSPFLYRKELLEYCNKRGIVLEAYSPLTRGKKLNNNILGEIAEKYKKTPAQILLRWIVQHNMVVIPKSVNENRIRENADIFNFEIRKNDMEKLNGLNESYSAIWPRLVIDNG
jgi:diketogulonate reductase-like aldo/keto reductase